MIISPPFLPEQTDKPDAEWVDKAMAQPAQKAAESKALEGSFPLSAALMWHDGIHIQAPGAPEGGYLPVRAIADGKVIYAKAGPKRNDKPDDPQNYSPHGVQWTDNGIVIIEHETEIGASNDAAAKPTKIKYYSLYMHLSGIARNAQTKAAWKAGDRIYRKDELGSPGQVYSHTGQIHFEICCDEANAEAIIGRKPRWSEVDPEVAPTADGRTDSVFGDILVYLPKTTPISAAEPVSHLRAAGGAALGTAQWVAIRYDKGTAYLSSYDTLGAPIGIESSDPDFEYKLYTEANKRHKSLDKATQASSSPSGWYELLRFGRNLGPDALPANAAHWRKIRTPAGDVWADLNAEGSHKFSDADFLGVRGWNCFDDDSSPNDQRCDSVNLKRWVRDPDPANADRMSREALGGRLGEDSVRKKLRRAICNFPSEWEQGTVEARHEWLRDPGNKYGLDDDQNWQCFADHCKSTTFADLPPDYVAAKWRFHPAEFITVLRRCGWLSEDELLQLLPKHAMRSSRGTTLWEAVPDANANFRTNSVARDHRLPLNRAMRKWGMTSPFRAATFFGSSIQETMWLGSLAEFGGTKLWYAPWHGRGFLQLTNPENYVDYWSYRGRVIAKSLRAAIVSAYQRIASTPPASRSNSGLQDINFPALISEITTWRAAVQGDRLADPKEALFAPSDSAGFYWVKNLKSEEADQPHLLERVAIKTNAGKKIYYRSQTFWRASARVNLPGAVARTNYIGINGFDARCVAYGYALAVLSEKNFPDDTGRETLWFPEAHFFRRRIS
ncbi:M23 family metallopeptidase [Variovorax sp. GT1P44]|uniref:M23 family metallopeptidase n=1 Tax=Variovorax sp. GT1P44 TaxID=3443742 RepID=UPI003F457ECB